MHTVLAPGLGKRLELDLTRLAAEAAVLALERLHLVERQEEVPFARELLELCVGELRDGDLADRKRVGRAHHERTREVRLRVDRVDDGVREQPFANRLRHHLVDAMKVVAVARAHLDCATR